MILTKENLAVVKAAATTTERILLHGIHVTEDYTEATDGRIFVRVPTLKGREEEVPVIPDCNCNGEPLEPVILDTESVKKIAKQLPKATVNPAVGWLQVDSKRSNAEKKFVCGTTDLKSSQVMRTEPVEGHFPNGDQIFPKPENATFRIGFGLHVLRNLLDTMSSCGASDSKYDLLTFHFTDSASAALVTGKNITTDQEITGVVMPIKIEEKPQMTRPARITHRSMFKRFGAYYGNNGACACARCRFQKRVARGGTD